MLVIPSHNCFRSQTIAFRVSPEEDEQINIAVSLSGMMKQDYITYKLLDRTINVKASCKVHRAVYDRRTVVREKWNKLNDGSEINSTFVGAFLCGFIAEKLHLCGGKYKNFFKPLDEKGRNG